MFKRRKLPPGYTIRANYDPGIGDSLQLVYRDRVIAHAWTVDGFSPRPEERYLRRMAWIDYRGDR